MDEKKKESLTELVFILDRSGSMCGMEKDTVGGFNAVLKEQKETGGRVLVSAVLFNTLREVLLDRVPLEEVRPMEEKDYRVGGGTALMDALGAAIHHIGNIHKYARKEDIPDKTLFVIMTDGYENASRCYGAEEVRSMVKRQQSRYGWEFLFLAANIDAAECAAECGIDRLHAAEFVCDGRGMELQFAAVAKAVKKVRCRESLSEDWKEELMEDTERRK